MESLDDLQHFTRVTLPSLKLTEQYLVLHVFALVNGRLSPGSKVRPLCVRERERERERSWWCPKAGRVRTSGDSNITRLGKQSEVYCARVLY